MRVVCSHLGDTLQVAGCRASNLRPPSNGSVAQGIGTTPTAELLRVIVAAEGMVNVAKDRNTVITAQECLAA